MPLHDSKRIEFSIDSGHIEIITDNGEKVPAYWAHPRIGQKFSGICLLHDWWGADHVIRLLANFFAQMGYYVIAPDMYAGALAHTATQAIKLYEKSQSRRFGVVDATLSVLESHHLINHSVATIGIGMGGTMAFEAAIRRDDLEAAVAYSGFPQDYFGQFARSNTPILAFYGDQEPYIKMPTIKRLKTELRKTPLRDKHQVIVVEGAKHEFFSAKPNAALQPISKQVINQTLLFLEQFIIQPQHQRRQDY